MNYQTVRNRRLGCSRKSMPNTPPNRGNLLWQNIQISPDLLGILAHALPLLRRYILLVKLRWEININNLQRGKQKMHRLYGFRPQCTCLHLGY